MNPVCEIEPIKNQIVFQFEEDTSRGRFNEKTAGGLVIMNFAEKQVDFARWGKVLALGPDVNEEFDVGDVILIEQMRWTNAFQFTGTRYWITTADDVLAVRDEA